MGQEKREDGGCWLSGTIGSSVMEMSWSHNHDHGRVISETTKQSSGGIKKRYHSVVDRSRVTRMKAYPLYVYYQRILRYHRRKRNKSSSEPVTKGVLKPLWSLTIGHWSIVRLSQESVFVLYEVDISPFPSEIFQYSLDFAFVQLESNLWHNRSDIVAVKSDVLLQAHPERVVISPHHPLTLNPAIAK
jgi:hypothetical protein